MKPCNACRFDHDPRMTCGVARRLRETAAAGKQDSHAASNGASNNPVASNTEAVSASNRKRNGMLRPDGEIAQSSAVLGVDGQRSENAGAHRDGGVDRKQRWDRAAYNEYQRDLMRKKRANIAAGATA